VREAVGRALRRGARDRTDAVDPSQDAPVGGLVEREARRAGDGETNVEPARYQKTSCQTRSPTGPCGASITSPGVTPTPSTDASMFSDGICSFNGTGTGPARTSRPEEKSAAGTGGSARRRMVAARRGGSELAAPAGAGADDCRSERAQPTKDQVLATSKIASTISRGVGRLIDADGGSLPGTRHAACVQPVSRERSCGRRPADARE